jgi:hypothetical protein
LARRLLETLDTTHARLSWLAWRYSATLSLTIKAAYRLRFATGDRRDTIACFANEGVRMRERRRHQRWPAYLGGRASFFHGQASADFVIRNTSENGAKLVVHGGDFVPEEFELSIPQRDTVYRARACWRGPDVIGVELQPLTERTADDESTVVPLSLMRRIRRMETENSVLKRRIAELTE